MSKLVRAKPMGRPRKPTSTGNACYDSQLYQFLERRLKQFAYRGSLNVRSLADACGKCPQSLYRYFKRDRLTADAAGRIVKASGGRIASKDLLPFLIP